MTDRATALWREPTTVIPPVALLLLVLTWGNSALPGVVLVIVALALAAVVLAAVHHAEVVAHRVGEPLGSLLLAVAVTVIEVGLIVSLMIGGDPDASTVARDTVFAAVMICLNGILGISLLLGSIRQGYATFRADGSGAALATVATLATLCLVLPTFTTSAPGPTYTSVQLAFAAVASLLLYALFVFVQTVRHPYQFGSAEDGDQGDAVDLTMPHEGDRPTARTAWISVALLVIALVAVVGLAKVESPAIKDAVRAAGLPLSFVGVVIALLVLLPEGLSAMRAARQGNTQRSVNLAMGSAMASIGLTIPVVAVASVVLDEPLTLGLGATGMVLLAITTIVGVLTVTPGRATLLQGGVHLALFGAFLVLSVQA
jgi:Ca2+:H+ antiporter